MPLAEADKLDVLLALGLPARVDVAFGFFGHNERLRRSELARLCMDNLTASQEAKVLQLLPQWRELENDADTLKVDGLDSDSNRTRRLIVQRIADAIGYAPPDDGGMRIARR